MLHFWGAAGAARAAGLAQSMEEAGLGSRELSLGPPILPAPGVARSAQLIALPGEFVFQTLLQPLNVTLLKNYACQFLLIVY